MIYATNNFRDLGTRRDAVQYKVGGRNNFGILQHILRTARSGSLIHVSALRGPQEITPHEQNDLVVT